MAETEHPSCEKLSAYLMGTLPDPWSERVGEHLKSCTSCSAKLAQLSETEGGLAANQQLEVTAGYPGESPTHPKLAHRKAMVSPSSRETESYVKPDPALGRLGEYELLAKLGEGGMGAVYKARQTKLDRLVAVKLLAKSRTEDAKSLARFEREMRAVGRLNHPNLVQAHDAREIDGTHFLVMEHVDGLNLSEVVHRYGPLPIADACEVICQAAVGLQYTHENGLVHRDVKPSNLMLTPEGQVKILDLGLALLAADQRDRVEVTVAGTPIGTLDYIAPEQVDDSHNVDIRADIYSLGCTLYKLVSGRAPFSGTEYDGPFRKMKAHIDQPVPPIHQYRNGIPESLAAVVEAMLAKKPSERFATPAEVATALKPLAAGCDLPGLMVKTTGASSAADLAAAALAPTAEYRSSAHANTHTTPGLSVKPASSASRTFPNGKIWAAIAATALLLIATGVTIGVVFLGWFSVLRQRDVPMQPPQATGPDGSEKREPAGTESPLRITSFRVIHYRDRVDRSELAGEIGVDSFAASVDDPVQVSAELTEPAFCFLLAFNTDGSEQLCYPSEDTLAPEKTLALQYPQDPSEAFYLTDGEGQQAFVLVASRSPLPSYAEWRGRLGDVSWQHLDSHGVLQFDRGTTRMLGVDRGSVRKLKGLETFDGLCRSLEQHSRADAMQAIGFPVLPSTPAEP